MTPRPTQGCRADDNDDDYYYSSHAMRLFFKATFASTEYVEIQFVYVVFVMLHYI
jgi:hypothetical protein